MKLLKAFIRMSRADQVVRALEDGGAPGVTLSHVHGIGYGYDPLTFTLAPNEVNRAIEVLKVEVVCRDADVRRLLATLQQAARTGSEGDGIVFVTPVEQAIRIRTGEDCIETENHG